MKPRLPMLSADCNGDTMTLKYPGLVSPKLDGFRCIIQDGKAMSRNLKPIRNEYVQERLFGLPPGLDGELIVGKATGGDVFNRTSSGVTSKEGQPDFRFFVFDRQPITPADPIGFKERLDWIREHIKYWKACVLVEHKLVKSEEELLKYEAWALSEGYEGVMFRDPLGPYKEGRATLREGWLTKVKRFHDAEALCVGYKELLHNDNVATRSATGHLERSTHKAGKRASGMLGALECLHPDSGLTFDVGTGFSAAQRKQLWATRDTLVGRQVKYKFFPTGAKERPRFPTWLGFRDEGDM